MATRPATRPATPAAADWPDPVDNLIARLTAAGRRVDRNGDAWIAQCPAHDDGRPSLSIRRNDRGDALVYCFAGRHAKAIAAAAGLRLTDLYAEPPKGGRLARRHARRSSPTPARATAPRPRRYTAPDPKFAAMASEARAAIGVGDAPSLDKLADELGVSTDALASLGVGWAPPSLADGGKGRARFTGAWSIPMVDGRGAVCGIQFRERGSGRKWSAAGGASGLFVPQPIAEAVTRGDRIPGDVFVCEGASDTAAMLDAGHRAIGRHATGHGAKLIAELLDADQVVIVADDDDAGTRGAEAIASAIHRRTGIRPAIVRPPEGHKDIRAWWNATAAHHPRGSQR